MTRSKASIEAQERYDNKAYDRVLIRFPKGTKARITALGATVNGFTVRAVHQALDNAQPMTQPDTTDTTPGD